VFEQVVSKILVQQGSAVSGCELRGRQLPFKLIPDFIVFRDCLLLALKQAQGDVTHFEQVFTVCILMKQKLSPFEIEFHDPDDCKPLGVSSRSSSSTFAKTAKNGPHRWTKVRGAIPRGSFERACKGRNSIELGSVRPALHLDNRIFRQAAMDGEVGKAPATRLTQPLDALAEPYLRGLRTLGPSIPIFWYGLKWRFHSSGTHTINLKNPWMIATFCGPTD